MNILRRFGAVIGDVFPLWFSLPMTILYGFAFALLLMGNTDSGVEILVGATITVNGFLLGVRHGRS